jgi:hypothetical protein
MLKNKLHGLKFLTFLNVILIGRCLGMESRADFSALEEVAKVESIPTGTLAEVQRVEQEEFIFNSKEFPFVADSLQNKFYFNLEKQCFICKTDNIKQVVKHFHPVHFQKWLLYGHTSIDLFSQCENDIERKINAQIVLHIDYNNAKRKKFFANSLNLSFATEQDELLKILSMVHLMNDSAAIKDCYDFDQDKTYEYKTKHKTNEYQTEYKTIFTVENLDLILWNLYEIYFWIVDLTVAKRMFEEGEIKLESYNKFKQESEENIKNNRNMIARSFTYLSVLEKMFINSIDSITSIAKQNDIETNIEVKILKEELRLNLKKIQDKIKYIENKISLNSEIFFNDKGQILWFFSEQSIQEKSPYGFGKFLQNKKIEQRSLDIISKCDRSKEYPSLRDIGDFDQELQPTVKIVEDYLKKKAKKEAIDKLGCTKKEQKQVQKELKDKIGELPPKQTKIQERQNKFALKALVKPTDIQSQGSATKEGSEESQSMVTDRPKRSSSVGGFRGFTQKQLMNKLKSSRETSLSQQNSDNLESAVLEADRAPHAYVKYEKNGQVMEEYRHFKNNKTLQRNVEKMTAQATQIQERETAKREKSLAQNLVTQVKTDPKELYYQKRVEKRKVDSDFVAIAKKSTIIKEHTQAKFTARLIQEVKQKALEDTLYQAVTGVMSKRDQILKEIKRNLSKRLIQRLFEEISNEAARNLILKQVEKKETQ